MKSLVDLGAGAVKFYWGVERELYFLQVEFAF
jgi:hypothetical protein